MFAQGTKLIVTPPDKSLDADKFPKPIIFSPSLAEIKFHMSGTYICLLENFFPKVIKIHWKEKDGKRILKSQQGDTMKTKDTYMKFSWLTVARESLAKEQKCIITHESNKRGIDEEIVFRSMKRGMCIYGDITSHYLFFSKGNTTPFLLNINEKKQRNIQNYL
uniref:Immunoglobulin C1-set domain-containing protein n=1 Tax=Mustela putorius furo TaxID=9669 RepID=M3Z3F6_MUSPF